MNQIKYIIRNSEEAGKLEKEADLFFDHFGIIVDRNNTLMVERKDSNTISIYPATSNIEKIDRRRDKNGKITLGDNIKYAYVSSIEENSINIY